MKRLVAGMLAGVLAVGMMLSGCSKQLTPEEQAASDAAVLAQQLQDEEDKTGLKRLISNNLTEYEQPFYDFVTGLQNGDAVGTAKALGVPNTFGDKIQNWIVVNNYETFQKAELKHICFNSAKDGSTAVINVYMGTPSEVTADTTPDYVMNVDYVDGAWALTPPTGVVKDYTFTTPTNKVSFEGTDLSQYAAKSASTGEWSITLPRALDFENDSTYVITNDMGDYNGHVYDVTSDGTVSHMLLADLDTDTKETYQAKLEAVLKEAYDRDGECVICGEKAGYFGLCKKCWRSLMNNAALRSDGYTKEAMSGTSGHKCVVCGSDKILCRKVCGKCYSLMRSHGFTSPEQLIQYKQEKTK